jgi:transposase
MNKPTFYLALDAHPGDSQLAVLSPKGQIMSCKNYPTTAPDLIEAVCALRGAKTLVVEESQIADWIQRTLTPFVDKLIIANPKENAWIAKSKHIDDKVAACRLAKLLWGGYIKPVHHGDLQRQQFKELVLHYHDLTRQTTRFKNKLKAEFIAKAVPVKGPAVYDPALLKTYLRKLSQSPLSQDQAKNYSAILKHIIELRLCVFKKIRSSFHRYPEIHQFRLIPGVGQVSAFTISAIIDTPHRFANKRQLWSYIGLAKSQKVSNGKIYRSMSSSHGNKLLKYLFLQAAMIALRSNQPSRFKETADRLSKNGVSTKNIRRTVARQIASTIFTIWKSGEPYRHA